MIWFDRAVVVSLPTERPITREEVQRRVNEDRWANGGDPRWP